MTRPIIKAALKIDELSYTLENVCNDTKRKIEELPDDEIVNEASYVLTCFFESGHINNDALVGESDGTYNRQWALGEIKKLRALLKKYRTALTPYDEYLPVGDRFKA